MSQFIFSSELLMAKRGGGGGGGRRGGGGSGPGVSSKKKKNNNNPSARGNNSNNKKKGKATTKSSKSKTTNSRAAQINDSRNKKQSSSSSNSSSSPPWQVLGKKDRIKNIKAEKQRRKLAREEGIHNVPDTEGYKLSTSFLSNEDKAILSWKRFKASPQDEVDFIGAYLDKQLPPKLGAPEIAFLGRSNVGKSSLLNKLVSSDTARVGKTPGATASVNLYGMFRKDKAILGLVDLPGFGYAKLSKEAKESVQVAAENYLGNRKELMLGILLVDIRRIPSDDDRAVLAALYDSGVPIIVVATKIDKVSKNNQSSALEVIRNGLGLPDGQPLFVSSVTGEGIKDLWRIIMEACEGGVEELSKKLLEQGSGDEDNHDGIIHEGGEEIAYSQGFDWIHDSASVMYEDDGTSSDWVSWDAAGSGGGYYDAVDDDEYDNNYDFDEKEDFNSGSNMPKQSLRSLKKLAKDMENRGEL